MLSPQEEKIISKILDEKKLKLSIVFITIACLASLALFFYLGNKIANVSNQVSQFGNVKISSIKAETQKEQALKKMLLDYHQLYMDAGGLLAAKLFSLLASFAIIFSLLFIVFIVRDIKIGRIIKKLQKE